MGLGKSRQLLEAIRRLKVQYVLIICPKIAEGVWEGQIEEWFKPLRSCSSVVVTGTPEERQDAWKQWDELVKKSNPDETLFLISHYEMIPEVLSHDEVWECVVVDEAHKFANRANHWTVFRNCIKCTYMFPTTGSPIRNHPGNIIPLLMLVERGLTSYWDTLWRYFAKLPNEFGSGFAPGLCKDVPGYKQLLRKYMIRRTKEHIPDLPAKVRRKIPLTMHPKQAELYESLATKLMAELPTGGYFLAATHVAKLTRLRQVLVSPRLLGFDYPSPAMDAVESYVRDAQEDGHQVAIFTLYADAIPLIEEAARKVAKITTVAIQGGLKKSERSDRISRFQKGEAQVAVCSIGVAEAFTLTKAHKVLFIAPGWNPAENEQAEDRVHRLGLTMDGPLVCDYLCYKNSVDELVWSILDGKYSAEQLILKDFQNLLIRRPL